MTTNNQTEPPQRPGAHAFVTIAFGLELTFLLIALSLFSGRDSSHSILLWLLIFAAFAFPVAAFYAWSYFERHGWYADCGAVQIPSLPYTTKDSFGANVVIFAEDRIIRNCRMMFAGQAEMLYRDIKHVSVHFAAKNNYFFSLSKTTKNYYKVGEEPLSFSVSAFPQKEWVVMLRLLELCAPQAEFDALAQHLKSGKIPRF